MGKHFLIDRATPRIMSEGKEYLQFVGTAYLGMSSLPAFEQLLIEGIKRYGANHGSSRNSNIQLTIYENFERFFAEKAGADKARLLSSGFLAGHLAVQVISQDADLVWVAPDTHPAVLPDPQSGDSHESFRSWASRCLEKSKTLIGQRILLVSNALNPLKPEVYDFDWVRELSPLNRYALVIDDSHAFGVIGRDIFGTYGQWSRLPAKVLVCGSLGKALSIPAGIIVGEKSLFEAIERHPIFRSSSPPAPSALFAFLAAQDLYFQQLEKLRSNTSFVTQALEAYPAFAYTKEYPVITFQEHSWVERLLQSGIIISSFPYPKMDDPALNRIVLSAAHSEKDVAYLVHKLKELG